MITIITGTKNSGKTNRLETWYMEEKRGAGCFTKKVYEDGHWIGYDLYLVPGGKVIPFIRLLPFKYLLKDEDLLIYQRFAFSQEAFREGCRWLETAIDEGKEPIWIDEIGNQEMFGNGFDSVVKKGIGKGLDMRMVFRYQYIDKLIAHYNLRDYKRIDCRPEYDDR